MNDMKRMFGDMRGGWDMGGKEVMPPSEEGVEIEEGMTCPACGAKFKLEPVANESELSEGIK